MKDFSNISINIGSLPNFQEAYMQAVESRYAKVLWINYSLPFFIYILAVVGAFYFLPVRKLFISLGSIALLIPFIISAIEIYAGFPRRKFGVREQDIIYQKGFLVYKETVVPFRRIQHVEIRQNLIARMFNLFSLKLYTAGDSMGDLVISGLNEEVANKLKEKVLQKQEAE